MKTLLYAKRMLAIVLVMVALLQNSYAQDSSKQSSIQNKVAAKDFVFEAQTTIPQRGITRQLNSYYFLKVKGDSLISDLPYFGRAYSAPINASDGGIRFTSTSFDYSSKDRRKGGWDILIKPKEANDVQQLVLNVFTNGRATLQVISNNRQPISFDGIIREGNTKKD